MTESLVIYTSNVTSKSNNKSVTDSVVICSETSNVTSKYNHKLASDSLVLYIVKLATLQYNYIPVVDSVIID